jgi:predicted restriction endonuclease
MNYWNSTIRIKPGAARMKRSQIQRVPGTARLERKPFGLKPKRESPAEKKFKREVRERDNYTCQFPGCDRSSKRIDVHHIAKRSQRPDLKLEVSNGLCLCRFHHSWTDTHHDEAVRIGLLSTESYELAQKREREAA